MKTKYDEFKDSTELCQYLSRELNGECVLQFSLGKDSVAAYLHMRRFFKKIHLVYNYTIEGLSFIEEAINYFERKFQQRIIKVPNTNFYKQLNLMMFMPPCHVEPSIELSFPNVDRNEMIEWVRDELGNPGMYTGIGLRVSDSIYRRRQVKHTGVIIPKHQTFYPVYDFLIRDVIKIMKDEDVKLGPEYLLFGRSFDGYKYQYIKPIYDKHPEDFKKIQRVFPLIEMEILRYEKV